MLPRRLIVRNERVVVMSLLILLTPLAWQKTIDLPSNTCADPCFLSSMPPCDVLSISCEARRRGVLVRAGSRVTHVGRARVGSGSQ